MFKKFRCMLPMDLQFFAEAGTGDGGAAGTGDGQQTQQPPAAPQIDYNKIQTMLEGTLAAKEDTALKAYFKQQGLSEDEMKQAIAAFKAQKASQQPDVNALQTQAAQAQAAAQQAQVQAAAQQAQVQAAATMAAVGLGIDAKTIPYVLKMADLSQVMGQDGKINDEALKTALNKVLEDVPALKPAPAGQTGFVQVGATGQSGQQTTNDDALKKAFGL